MISIKVDTRAALAGIQRDKDKVKFAIAVGLTKTAQSAQSILAGKTLNTAFDRPTPFTLKGTFIKPAKPQALVAVVSFKDRQTQYLGPEVAGGNRQPKGFELALQSAGVLPGGYICVAGKGAPLDAFGNVPRSYITEVLRQLAAGAGSYGGASLGDAKKRARGIKKFGQFVAIPPGMRGLQAGIYQRVQFGLGAGIRAVFIFVPKATYKPRLMLQPVADEAVSSTMNDAFKQAFNT